MTFKILSYLIYILAYELMTIGGTFYVVFVLNQPGEWWILGVFLSGACFKPERWSALWDDAIAEKYRAKREEKAAGAAS